jgi:hypothetical protein
MRRLCWEEDVGDDDAKEGWRRMDGVEATEEVRVCDDAAEGGAGRAGPCEVGGGVEEEEEDLL